MMYLAHWLSLADYQCLEDDSLAAIGDNISDFANPMGVIVPDMTLLPRVQEMAVQEWLDASVDGDAEGSYDPAKARWEMVRAYEHSATWGFFPNGIVTPDAEIVLVIREALTVEAKL